MKKKKSKKKNPAKKENVRRPSRVSRWRTQGETGVTRAVRWLVETLFDQISGIDFPHRAGVFVVGHVY